MLIGTNRGLTLYKNFVISVTGDCKVIWTNRDTGEVVKTVKFDDPKTSHCSLTAAPLLVDDKLIVPGSGGDQGSQGHDIAEGGAGNGEGDLARRRRNGDRGEGCVA
jgi:alcohol dehydrogenase (cytochrome c)